MEIRRKRCSAADGIYSRAITKSVPLLQPEHGFCQQNSIDIRMKKWQLLVPK